MQVSVGVTAENFSTGRYVKLNLTCDEDDLERICLEQDIIKDGLSNREVFKILAGEAEKYLDVMQVKSGIMTGEDFKAKHG